MSDPMTTCLTVSANADISGIGIRTAFYVQNLLSFLAAFWALRDGRITPTKLDELKKQSTTILFPALAILISIILQTHNHGVSNYHASIVLNFSWMNNTNFFIYIVLYIYHRVCLSEAEFNEEVKLSTDPDRSIFSRARARWYIYCTKQINRIGLSHDRYDGPFSTKFLLRHHYERDKVVTHSITIISFLHLSLMGAVGVWLWIHPAGFGDSGLCSLSATISILGKQVPLGSSGLRIWSLIVYITVLYPGGNLLIVGYILAMPLIILSYRKPKDKTILYTTRAELGILAICDIVMLVDTEVAIKKNTNKFHLNSETQWTVGQILPLLLLCTSLYNLTKSILKRNMQIEEQLLEASEKGEKDLVETLLKQKAKKNALDQSVQIAVIHGHSSCVQILLNHQANPDSKDVSSMSLLHCAAKNGYWDIVNSLVKHKADVNSKDHQSKSPLHHAAQSGHLDIVESLMRYEADVNLKDHHSKSPLHYAAQNGHLDIVRFLLECGGDVNLKDYQSKSPLHHAAKNGQLYIVKSLLEHEADINLEDHQSMSPLHYAAQNGFLEIAKSLLEHEADVNLKDIVQALLKHKADVNLKG
ncbi:hypothetical protein C0992_001153 [Termitomyces sp. T32_za158]|nr:hypothetical protein C0992_001153 [Termitomyces sp. T32_za158]